MLTHRTRGKRKTVKAAESQSVEWGEESERWRRWRSRSETGGRRKRRRRRKRRIPGGRIKGHEVEAATRRVRG